MKVSELAILIENDFVVINDSETGECFLNKTQEECIERWGDRIVKSIYSDIDDIYITI